MDVEEDAPLRMDRTRGAIVRRVVGDDERIGDTDQGVVPEQALGPFSADEEPEVIG